MRVSELCAHASTRGENTVGSWDYMYHTHNHMSKFYLQCFHIKNTQCIVCSCTSHYTVHACRFIVHVHIYTCIHYMTYTTTWYMYVRCLKRGMWCFQPVDHWNLCIAVWLYGMMEIHRLSLKWTLTPNSKDTNTTHAYMYMYMYSIYNIFLRIFTIKPMCGLIPQGQYQVHTVSYVWHKFSTLCTSYISAVVCSPLL